MRKLFLLFFALMATTFLWAYDFQSGDLYYKITSSSEPYTVEVSDAISSITTATIPETVTYNGITYSVTSIGNEAFYLCFSLTAIAIPNSVTSIGNSAFNYCSKLTSITIPNSVTSIGESAFSSCLALTSITLPNNITSIGNKAFSSCTSLVSITIPNSVTSIGNETFRLCNALTSITLPYSVTSIGNSAFSSCSKLTKTNYTGDVTDWCNIKFGDSSANPMSNSHNFYINDQEIKDLVIPNTVDSIHDYAFYGCSSLISVTTEAITPPILGANVFSNCKLSAIYIPNNTLSAYQSAWGNEYTYINNETTLALHVEVPGTLLDLIFDAGTRPVDIVKLNLTGTLNDDDFTCMRETMTSLVDVNLSGITNTSGVDFSFKDNLIRVILPDNLTSIEKEAFYYCLKLTSVTIPNSVTSIGDEAFAICSALTTITIPNSVTSIGESAFYYCSSLTAITIPNCVTSIGNDAFYNCSKLTSITIPNSVTSIGDDAFYKCSSLTSVTIPNSVTSIGYNAFYDCISLTSITIPSSVTTIRDFALSGCFSLTSITCLGTIPPDADNLYAPTTTCQLIVPNSAYDAYLHHAYWGQFLNILPAYQVTLQANNVQWGEVDGAGLYTQETTITATPYEGYTFTKWSDGNTENPRTLQLTSDTTLTAEFDVDKRLLVTFVDWDGTVLSSVKVTSGDAATAPADPTREGYTFIGWDKDFSMVTDHMTITAQYQINRYRVRFFDFDDTLLHTDSVEYQAAAVAPADPYRTGYTFTGWDKAFDSITADLDVYAQYEMGEDYDMTIVFTNSEDSDSEIYSQSLTIKIPAAPLIEGFTFLKWRIVESDLTDVITIQAIYEADTPTSAEVYTNPANPAQKLLRNGQVYILQDGKTYSVMGQEM